MNYCWNEQPSKDESVFSPDGVVRYWASVDFLRLWLIHVERPKIMSSDPISQSGRLWLQVPCRGSADLLLGLALLNDRSRIVVDVVHALVGLHDGGTGTNFFDDALLASFVSTGAEPRGVGRLRKVNVSIS